MSDEVHGDEKLAEQVDQFDDDVFWNHLKSLTDLYFVSRNATKYIVNEYDQRDLDQATCMSVYREVNILSGIECSMAQCLELEISRLTLDHNFQEIECALRKRNLPMYLLSGPKDSDELCFLKGVE
jgi:hypothetical protein